LYFLSPLIDRKHREMFTKAKSLVSVLTDTI
jgi:hypothetical protein